MARTVNPTLHTVRRDAFLDVAQRLIQTKGYEAMSIQDLLNELEASKGAFYHYFDSKQTLLEAVVERFADGAMASLEPVLGDPDLPALTKLERVFAGIASLKAEIMIPLFSAIVRQGVDEGTLHVDSPDDTAKVLVALMLGFQLQATDLFMARQAGTITFEVVQRAVAANNAAFERILGIPKGSLTLTDERTLRFWFG